MKGGSVRCMSRMIVPYNSRHMHLHSPFFSEDFSLDVGAGMGERLVFYEPITRIYFRSTLCEVVQAEYHFNRNYVLGKMISLNEYLEFLGLSKVAWGEDIGWWGCSENCDGIPWIDFWHTPSEPNDPNGVYYKIEILVWPEQF